MASHPISWLTGPRTLRETEKLISLKEPLELSNRQSNFRAGDQPDGRAGLGSLLGYDHQSTAWLVALPSVLDICERYSFRVYTKLTFCGVRHHLLKGFHQNVARWNPGGTQNC